MTAVERAGLTGEERSGLREAVNLLLLPAPIETSTFVYYDGWNIADEADANALHFVVEGARRLLDALDEADRQRDGARERLAVERADYTSANRELAAALREADRRAQAVRELHVDDSYGVCTHCRLNCECIETKDETAPIGDCTCPWNRPYPCPTLAALDGPGGPAEGVVERGATDDGG